ncbi:Dehydrosqualene desaturase [uncultured Clostridium sp.]|uniref:FAD-dependent oxidoreductase n=1 Tax=uncultured Clostridium sp. TaxID=59620 RepID=UPI0008224F88|nr:FAD-dependent oxidoreductase [uncultured Clostridium sp.]SCJ93707.1 Dehydrosqualene desaturase [uncultured Clostridium sp.]
MKYDVIVVGGGLAGLSSALKLSQNGKKVAIFEKHHMIGGYATNFKRKDKDGNLYIFDVALHGIGGLLPDNAFYNHMKDINMINKVEFLRKSEAATIFNNNNEIDIPDDFEEYLYLLINKYEHCEEGIRKLFCEINELNLELKSRKIPMLYQKLQNISLYDYLKSFNLDDELINDFGFLWLYYGLPPKKINALYYILAWISYHIGGTFYVKGGAGKLSDTFEKEIKVNGGDIYLSSEIVKVDVKGKKVTTIHTKNGEEYTADKFIVACDPIHFTNLISDNNEVVKSYRNKLINRDIGISLSQLYIGLDCKTTEVGINKSDYIINTVNHEESYESALRGDYSNTSYGITSYDILDPDLNKDVGVFVVVVGDHIKNWPSYKSDEYKTKKEEVKEELLKLVYERFPKVKDHIKVLELGTPHTMKRYTNNSQGAVYGFEQNVKQGGFNRLSNKSDFNNVYLAGSWTNPGGGFEGAITGGILTADRLLREEKIALDKSVEVTEENDDLVVPDMEISTFMIGMTANFDSKTVAREEKILLEFIFDDKWTYYIQIKNKKAKLLCKNPGDKIDVTIRTSYKVWFNIAFCGLDGKGAMFDGKLSVLGSPDIFLKIPKYFSTSSLSNVYKNEISNGKLETNNENLKDDINKINILLWLTLTLMPWIVTDIISRYYMDGSVIALGSILYTAVLMLLIKPNRFKSVTKLEGITFITFSIYGLTYNLIPEVFEMKGKYIINIVLILTFFISALIKKPITEDYSKEAYNERMVSTKLFKKININLTLLWAAIFLIQLIIKVLVVGPLNSISQLLAIIGLIISYYYPKLKLSEFS